MPGLITVKAWRSSLACSRMVVETTVAFVVGDNPAKRISTTT
jgi:hypothetical protein